MDNSFLVTVYCPTYNHENYIRDALDGILMQKTDFHFEVIVHDDASIDGTVDIIKEYQREYPEIIRPIFQSVNQYSQGHRIFSTFVLPKSVGKYVAVCEGDDYWTDERKLQKQVDYLENHPECALCVCATKFLDSQSRKTIDYPQSEENKVYSTEDIIKAGGGGLFHTVSFVYRKRYAYVFPDFFTKYTFGDYPVAIFLSMQGTVYYLKDVMAVHRVNVPNSWTSKVSINKRSTSSHLLELTSLLNDFDEYSNYKFSGVISEVVAIHQINYHLLNKQFNSIKDLMKKVNISQLPLKLRIKCFVVMYVPALYSIYLKIRGVTLDG